MKLPNLRSVKPNLTYTTQIQANRTEPNPRHTTRVKGQTQWPPTNMAQDEVDSEYNCEGASVQDAEAIADTKIGADEEKVTNDNPNKRYTSHPHCI